MGVRVRFAVAVSSLVVAGPALASEPTTDNTRYLSDPAYLPLVGEIHGVTSFTWSDGRGKTFDSLGALQSSFRDQGNSIFQSLEYGITDYIAVSLSMGYGPFDKRVRDFSAGGTTTTHLSGFTDPHFGLTWRVIDQALSPSPVNLDLFASYSPDLIGARAATATSDGNEGRGGQEGRVGAAISHVWDGFTVYGSASANFVGRRDVFNPSTGATIRQDGITSFSVDLASQARLTDAISVNAGIGETFVGKADIINGASGIEHIAERANNTHAQLGLNYTVIPDALVASASYRRNNYGTALIDFPTSPASNESTRGRTENVWGVTLNYAVR